MPSALFDYVPGSFHTMGAGIAIPSCPFGSRWHDEYAQCMTEKDYIDKIIGGRPNLAGAPGASTPKIVGAPGSSPPKLVTGPGPMVGGGGVIGGGGGARFDFGPESFPKSTGKSTPVYPGGGWHSDGGPSGGGSAGGRSGGGGGGGSAGISMTPMTPNSILRDSTPRPITPRGGSTGGSLSVGGAYACPILEIPNCEPGSILQIVNKGSAPCNTPTYACLPDPNYKPSSPVPVYIPTPKPIEATPVLPGLPETKTALTEIMPEIVKTPTQRFSPPSQKSSSGTGHLTMPDNGVSVNGRNALYVEQMTGDIYMGEGISGTQPGGRKFTLGA